jgi:nucleoside-diphosphate-sugar epimerase
MAKTALVLGGTGPTGPFIVEGLLNRNYEVTIMHGGFHEIDFPRPVEHIHGDVHFKETLEETLGNRTFDLTVFTYGRLRVTAEVMKGRTGRFISAGGGVVAPPDDPRWGPLGPPMALTEDAPTQDDPDLDRFSYLMHESEQVVLRAHREGHYVGTVFRYPMLYGPRQLGQRDWCIVRRILDRRPHYIIADGGIKLESQAYVENAAQFILLAVDKPNESGEEIFFVNDERTITMKQRIEYIAKVMNYDWELVSMPYELANPCHPFWRIQGHQIRDITKAKTLLGYKDVVPIEEGIERTVKWLLENRPDLGGELETQLNDSFDYAAEDELIRVYKEGIARAKEAHYPDYVWAHPYRHPRKPGEAWTPTRWRRRFDTDQRP